MSLLDDMQDAVHQGLQYMHGQAVTLHRVDGGADLAVTAVALSPIAGMEEQDDQGRSAGRTRTVALRASDIADITAYDEATIGGETWAIHGPPQSQSDSLIVLKLARKAAMERSRGSYRGRV